MKAIGVIPARLASTRLNEKVLALIMGKPMIQHVWERSSQAKRLAEVVIACDDTKIKEAAKVFGAKAVLTSRKHQSGSDRVAEAVASLDVDIVVNIQGDEPLIDPSIIDALVDVLEKEIDAPMATVIKDFLPEDDKADPNVVKAAVDDRGFASSFSRSVNKGEKVYKHIGIYAYRKDFLLEFSAMPKSENEIREKLEQLRALDGGFLIKTVMTDIQTIGVDTPEDLKRVEERLLKND